MATVLFAWELGAGLGHLMTLLPLMRELSQNGHRIVAAVRDLPRSIHALAGIPITYLQAPIKPLASRPSHTPPRTFAHILASSGFGDFEELRALVAGWRGLYDSARPDLIFFDHSPTALLAARGTRARKILIGTGFLAPPDLSPLPDLRPWTPGDPQRLVEDEARVLETANRVLALWKAPLLERVSRLYRDVDDNFLTTFPELDTYGEHRDTDYWGAWPNLGGNQPTWPDGSGPRIFVYVRSFPALPSLLALLGDRRDPTLVFADGINPQVQEHYRSPSLRFEDERLDLAQVGQQCDAAILNGTHGTTASMLLAGKPILQIPLQLEQAHTSIRVARMGAGILLDAMHPDSIARSTADLLASPAYAAAARRFAARYADFSTEEQIHCAVVRVEEFLN